MSNMIEGLSLNKGGNLSLNKENIPLKFFLGLGWEANAYNGADFDCDASIIIVGKDGKTVGKGDKGWDGILVGHPNLKAPGIIHHGDNRTGDGDGDDEVIEIDLTLQPPEVDKLVACITIHAGRARKQNFGSINNCYARLFDETGKQYVFCDLTEDFSSETAIVAVELYRHGNEWKIKGRKAGFNQGLSGLLGMYGINVPEESNN